MSDFLIQAYLWIKACHLISVIAWMAGLLYLPRLFVYHSQSLPGSPQSQTFIVMEQKLLRIIMLPAMTCSYLFGIMLISIPGVINWSAGWVHLKLGCVFLLTGFHHVLGKYARAFAADRRIRSESFFRMINEVPTILMIVIVIMAIVRPF